jgi:predicted dehydrogenase
MSVPPIRIALVGLGGVATAHIQAFRAEDWVDIVAGCDLDADAVATFSADNDAAGYTDLDDMLAAGGFDLCLVLTPAATHRALCEQVANAGFHVFCEKPLALTREDATSILDTCRNAGVQFFYGSCYRYLPAVSKARELILDGAVGNVKLMSEQVVGGMGPSHYHDYGPAHYPLGGPGGPGSGLVDHGVHLIDVMPWMCGSRIETVAGTGVISGEGAGVEYMHFSMDNGALGHLLYYSASWFTDLPGEAHMSEGLTWAIDGSFKPPGEMDEHPGLINVYGDRGALRIYHYANAVYHFSDSGVERIPLEGRATPGHFATQLEDCAYAIFEGRSPRVSGEDGVIALDAMLRVYGL